MRSDDWDQSGREPLVLILHDNLDFVRDASKGLRSRGISCQALYQVDFNEPANLVGQTIILMVDIDTIERHLRLLRRVLRAKSVEERLFFVNAKRYQKGDWAKINTYCDMVLLQARLWRLSCESAWNIDHG